MANNLLKSLMKAYGQYSAFTNQGAMQNQSMNAKNPISNSGNKNINVKPIASNQAKQYAMPSMNKPKTTTNNGIYNQNKGGYQPLSRRSLTSPITNPIPITDGREINFPIVGKPIPLRMKDATPNYMTQYNNSATPKKSNKVSYAAEPMKSQINNQYYATRNNGAFNENGFQQFMQQAQQQQYAQPLPQYAQPLPQYAQPQPINDPDVLAQPHPINNPDMFIQPQPIDDNRLSRPTFEGTAKRMSSVKKSSKKPTIMKTYEYSPQRMHEGTGKSPKMPSTNRTIYSTKKFY
jgi:hypothetical protein